MKLRTICCVPNSENKCAPYMLYEFGNIITNMFKSIMLLQDKISKSII